MEFIITRASLMSKEKPCKEAKKRKLTYTYDNVSFYTEDMWLIEINNLTDLMNLVEKYGKVIVSDTNLRDIKGYGEIMIYDDYIE